MSNEQLLLSFAETHSRLAKKLIGRGDIFHIDWILSNWVVE